MDNRQKLLNVELTLEAVQACLFVLDISNRISIQIANKKYFSALRVRYKFHKMKALIASTDI